MNRRVKKFDKSGGIDRYPIFYNGTNTFVHKDTTIDTTRNLEAFCCYNGLPSGRFAKLQGGYYILTDDNTWEFFDRTLDLITFENLYIALSKLTNPYTGKNYGWKYHCNTIKFVIKKNLKKRNFNSNGNYYKNNS